ncbi:hypothetical protein BC567DRAFT_281655 [Phyllosticta citribraziliensis]
MASVDDMEEAMPQTRYLNRPKSSGRSLDDGFKFSQAQRREIDFVGPRRRAGRDAALDTAPRASSASNRPELPSTREMNIEPKTGERFQEQGALQPRTAATQSKMDDNKNLNTSETAIDELAQLEPLDSVASKSPPSTSLGVPNVFSNTPLPTMPDTPLEPQSTSSETCNSSVHKPVMVGHDSVDQPLKTTMTLEPIPEVDGEDENSIDLSHIPTSRRQDVSMSGEQTAGKRLPIAGLTIEHTPAQTFAARNEPNCPLNPLAEGRPSSNAKPPSQGTKRMNDSGTARTHAPIHPGRDRFRVSKQSSSRQQSVPLPRRRNQPSGWSKKEQQDQFPSPEEVLQFLKFAVANESAQIIKAQRAQYEEENDEDRERHRLELQEALSRLTRVSTERDDLDARIKDHQAELQEAHKALEAFERAKKEIEAQAAAKTRDLAAQKQSIADLQKQIGAARKKGNMAAMLEASCHPLQNGIDAIRSQLEALQKEHQSKQDASGILKGVKQIKTSANQLPRVLTKARTSLDQLTERIGSCIEVSGQETLEFKESISSLKEYFSTEIKAAREELSSQQELQEQCTELRKENATLTERITGLQQKAADAKRQMEASSSSDTTLQQTVQERQRLRELEASQTRLQADLDAVRSELQLKQGDLESRSKSEKELQGRIVDLEKQASLSSNEKLKMEYEKKLNDERAQFSRDSKSVAAQQRAHYENRLREAEEEIKRFEEEFNKVSGPNSTVKRQEDEIRELSRQLRAQETKKMSLKGEQSASSVELATLRSQAEEHENELQKSHEKALAAERGRQEIQSELEKTKEALEKATTSTPCFEDFERLEELERQVLEAAETERSLLKQLKDADDNAKNFVERGIAEGKDVWTMEHYEVEQEWKGSKARYETEQEHLQVELYLHHDRNRYLEKENKKLRQQIEENKDRETAHRTNKETVPRQSPRERDESPAVGTPSPTSKSVGTGRMRKAADRSTNSIVNVHQSLVTLAPSTLPQSPRQVNFQSTPKPRFFDQEQEVLVPRTAASTFVHGAANNDFFEQNGTQVVPATLPNWTANENESIETAGVFSQAAAVNVGYSQAGERLHSSHSAFEDFYTESSNKEVSLIDKAPEPHTPRVGKSVAFQEGRPRSRANTGRRLSQMASSDGQRTPLASKSRLAANQQSPSVDREDENDSTPDFMKPSQTIAKTYASHATLGTQSSRPSKRPVSQTSTDNVIRKKPKLVDVISLDSQDTEESQTKRPARSLSQSTHVSESQSQSQSRSQPTSQVVVATPKSRMKSSHGRASMTGPPQSVMNRRRKSASSQMTDRFTQETSR